MKHITLEGKSQLNLKRKDLDFFVQGVSRGYQFLEGFCSGLEQIPSSLNRIIQLRSRFFSFLINYSVVAGQSKFGLWLHLTRHRGCFSIWHTIGIFISFGVRLLVSCWLFFVASHKLSGSVSPCGCWAGWGWELLALGIQIVLGECIWLWISKYMYVLSMGWATLICWIKLKRFGTFFTDWQPDRQWRTDRYVSHPPYSGNHIPAITSGQGEN